MLICTKRLSHIKLNFIPCKDGFWDCTLHGRKACYEVTIPQGSALISHQAVTHRAAPWTHLWVPKCTSISGTGKGYAEADLRRGEECIGVLLAGEPRLPALLLAVGPGLQAVLLGGDQVWAHILVSVEHQVLQQTVLSACSAARHSCESERPGPAASSRQSSRFFQA